MLKDLLPPLTEADILRFKELGQKDTLSNEEQKEFHILDQKMRESILTPQERQTYEKFQSLAEPVDPSPVKKRVRAWPYVLLALFIALGMQGVINAAGLDDNLATLLSGMACIIVPSLLWIYNKREKDNEFYPWYLPIVQLVLAYLLIMAVMLLSSFLPLGDISTLSLVMPSIIVLFAVWIPVRIYKKIKKSNA